MNNDTVIIQHENEQIHYNINKFLSMNYPSEFTMIYKAGKCYYGIDGLLIKVHICTCETWHRSVLHIF